MPGLTVPTLAPPSLSPVWEDTNPFSNRPMYLAQGLEQNTLSILSMRQAEQEALMRQAQMASVQNTMGTSLFGVGETPDPEGWTPEEAAMQTDRALAKLSTVNPELASQLAAQRTGGDPNTGFWDGLKEIAGDIIGGGLSFGGKVLDIISRPAYIIPNIFYDLADGGDFSIGEDIGGALTGDVRHNWNSVMQELGWDGDGVGGFLRATLGLGADILTDPLTWLFPMGAPMKIGAGHAASLISKDFAVEGATKFAKSVGWLAGSTDDDIAKALIAQWDSVFTSDMTLKQAMRGGLDPSDVAERAAAATNLAMDTTTQRVTEELFRLGHQTYGVVKTRNLQEAMRMGLVLGEQKIPASELKAFMEAAIKQGNRTKSPMFWSKDFGKEGSFEMGRMYASLAGGTRLRFSVPFTDFRWVTAPLNLGRLNKVLPSYGLNSFMRFGAGMSATTNLIHQIATPGSGVTWQHLTDYMQLGYKKFSELYPDIAKRTGGRGANMGSAFWTLSDKVGGITQHLDSGAALSRRGLIGHAAYLSKLEANNTANNLVSGIVKTVLGDDASQDWARRVQQSWGIGPRGSKKHTIDPVLEREVAEYIDMFPAYLDTADPEAIEAWFRRQHPEMSTLEARMEMADDPFSPAQVADLEAPTAKLAALEAKLAKAQKVAADVHASGNDMQVLQDFHTINQLLLAEAWKHEIPLGDVRATFEDATGIALEQTEAWRNVGVGLQHPVVYTVNNEGESGVFYISRAEMDVKALNSLRNKGVTSDLFQDTMFGKGIVLRNKRRSADDIAVVIRGGDFYEADEVGNTALQGAKASGQSSLHKERARIRAQVEKAKRGVEKAKQGPPPRTLPADATPQARLRATRVDPDLQALDEEIDIITDELLADYMRTTRPEARGVTRTLEDGTVEVVMWGPEDVMRVGDDFPARLDQRGYLHRTFTDEASTWLHGVLENASDAQQVLLAVPRMRARMARETIGMDLAEANDRVRQILADTFDDIDPNTLPEFLWETNLLENHARHINDLAEAVRARVLGKAGQRMNRANQLAPFMFSNAPRQQEYKWKIKKGMLAAVGKQDKKVVKSVLKMQKKGASYMGRQHKLYSTLADQWGSFNMLLDAGVVGEDQRLWTREMEAIFRYEARGQDMWQVYNKAKDATTNRITELEQEAATNERIRQATIEQLMSHGPQRAVPTRFDELNAPPEGEALLAAEMPKRQPTPDDFVVDTGTFKQPVAPGEEIIIRKTGEDQSRTGVVVGHRAGANGEPALEVNFYRNVQDLKNKTTITKVSKEVIPFNRIDRLDSKAAVSMKGKSVEKVTDIPFEGVKNPGEAGVVAGDEVWLRTAGGARNKRVRILGEEIQDGKLGIEYESIGGGRAKGTAFVAYDDVMIMKYIEPKEVTVEKTITLPDKVVESVGEEIQKVIPMETYTADYQKLQKLMAEQRQAAAEFKAFDDLMNKKVEVNPDYIMSEVEYNRWTNLQKRAQKLDAEVEKASAVEESNFAKLSPENRNALDADRNKAWEAAHPDAKPYVAPGETYIPRVYKVPKGKKFVWMIEGDPAGVEYATKKAADVDAPKYAKTAPEAETPTPAAAEAPGAAGATGEVLREGDLPSEAQVTFVWTDDLGTFQGRDQYGWRGPERKTEATALKDAQKRGEELAQLYDLEGEWDWFSPQKRQDFEQAMGAAEKSKTPEERAYWESEARLAKAADNQERHSTASDLQITKRGKVSKAAADRTTQADDLLDHYEKLREQANKAMYDAQRAAEPARDYRVVKAGTSANPWLIVDENGVPYEGLSGVHGPEGFPSKTAAEQRLRRGDLTPTRYDKGSARSKAKLNKFDTGEGFNTEELKSLHGSAQPVADVKTVVRTGQIFLGDDLPGGYIVESATGDHLGYIYNEKRGVWKVHEGDGTAFKTKQEAADSLAPVETAAATPAASASVDAYNELASKRMVGVESVSTPAEAYQAAEEMVEEAKRWKPTGKLTPAEKKAAKATRVKQWQDIMDAAEQELDPAEVAVFKAEANRREAQERVNKIQDRIDRIEEKDNPTANDELWMDEAEDLLNEAEEALAEAEDAVTAAQDQKAAGAMAPREGETNEQFMARVMGEEPQEETLQPAAAEQPVAEEPKAEAPSEPGAEPEKPESYYKDVEAEEGYLYHATDEDSANRIAEGGSVETRPGMWVGGEGVDHAVWAGTDPADLPKGEVLLRWKEQPGWWQGSPDPNAPRTWRKGQNPIPSAQVEVYANGKWVPIEELKYDGKMTQAAAERIYDDMLERGQVYFRKTPGSDGGSVLHRDSGEFVRERGGRKVRPGHEIQGELEALKRDLDEMIKLEPYLKENIEIEVDEFGELAEPGTGTKWSDVVKQKELDDAAKKADVQNRSHLSEIEELRRQIENPAVRDLVEAAERRVEETQTAFDELKRRKKNTKEAKAALDEAKRSRDNINAEIAVERDKLAKLESMDKVQRERTLTTTVAQRQYEAMRARRVAARANTQQKRRATEAAILMERARAELNRSMKEVNDALAKARGLEARVKPALVEIPTAGNLQGMTRMRIPGMEGMAMPDFIAEEWHRIYDMRGPGALRKDWRKFVLGPWKRWATYRWPGFHARNFFGAWFNNWLGGVTPKHYAFSFKVNNTKWHNEVVPANQFRDMGLGNIFGFNNEGKVTYGQVNNHLSSIGVLGANTRSVMEAANTINLSQEVADSAVKNRGKFRDVSHKLDTKMRNVGSMTESFHRTAAWSQGMEVTGGDGWGARAFTMMRHGDYTDLTPTEDIIRDLVPFYKWMRTNVPYQIRMLAENPAKMTLVSDKLKNWAYDAQGESRAEGEVQMPSYMKETLALPIPDWVPFIGSDDDAINYALFDLPYSDLYNGASDYWSAAIPVFRSAIESYALHKVPFSDRDLEGRQVRLGGPLGLPVIGDLLAATPFARKGEDGSVYISDTLENTLTAWPIYSKFRNWIEADEARVEARLGGFFSTVAGIGIKEADFTTAELDFYYNELEPILQTYRDLGVVFPDAQDFADAGDYLIGPTLPEVPSGLTTGTLATVGG